MKRIGILAAGVILSAFIAAPGGRSAGPPTYSADVEPIMARHCQSCHSISTPKAELVLDRGTGFRALVERPSFQAPSLRLVVPGNVEASYLWTKLQGPGAVGKQMPRTLFSSRKLPEKELEVIRNWIAGGALP